MRIALLLVAILVTAPALAADDGQITVRNRSSWEIQELYLSAVDANAWGPDLIGLEVIERGQSQRLADIPCGSYDVRVVNEDGAECVISGAVLCADHDDWTLTDDDLAGCKAE
mgnify:FL=1